MQGSPNNLPALPRRSTILWIILGFFAAAFAVYGMSLGNRFVAWDDNYLIVSNALVRGFSWQNIYNAFTSFDPELYDPLVFLTYQFDYTVGGPHAFMFHFDNLILHTLNALCVAWFLYLLSRRGWIGIIAGLLFAVHPLNVEAVSWAAARKDTLSTLFFLLSLIGYMYYREIGRGRSYWLSIGAFILGLLSKVMVLMLPVVLVLLDIRDRRAWSWKMIVDKIPYFLLSLLFGLVALFGKRDVVTESTVFEKILMAAKSTTYYLEKLFWPTHLSVLYPYTKPIVISSPDFFIPVVVVAALIAVAFACWNKARDVTFGIFFYLVTLIPTFFNFAKGGKFYFASDRYVYISEIGLIFLVLVLVDRFLLQGRLRQKMTTVLMGITAILLVFGFLAFKQSLTWHDTETLFLQTLTYYPDATAARINLGYVYRESSLYGKALDQFNEVLRLEPNNAIAMANIGVVYEKQGKTTDAIAEYQKAMKEDPKQQDAFFSLGMLYERMGRLDDALQMYLAVAKISPGFAGVYNNLGSIYVQKGDLKSAETAYKKGISINPYYSDAHFNLGYVEEKLGNLDVAAKEYETTLQLEGDKVATLTPLAGIYAQQNKTQQTIDVLQRILKLDPQNAFANQLMDAMRQHGLVR